MNIRAQYKNTLSIIYQLKRSGYYQFEPIFSDMVKMESISWKLFKLIKPSKEEILDKSNEVWELYGEFECHCHDKFDEFVKQLDSRIKELNKMFYEKNKM